MRTLRESLRVLFPLLLAAIGYIAGWRFGPGEPQTEEGIIRDFHRWYHGCGFLTIESNTHWLGVRAMKNPFDLWIYQEILYETRPDVLIETGTHRGGSAYYYATIFDALGKGRVYTMDVKEFPKPRHSRMNFRLDSSIADSTLTWIRQSIQPGERVMVTLDSLHDKEHVLGELDRYAPLVTPGCYLVVEDTNLNGHPVRTPFSPRTGHEGPAEALQEWLPKHPEFTPDLSREKFGMTFNPGGWLKRR